MIYIPSTMMLYIMSITMILHIIYIYISLSLSLHGDLLSYKHISMVAPAEAWYVACARAAAWWQHRIVGILSVAKKT